VLAIAGKAGTRFRPKTAMTIHDRVGIVRDAAVPIVERKLRRLKPLRPDTPGCLSN